MRKLAHAFALSAILAAAACGGGGGDERAKPLAHQFDDMHIAAVPLDEKKGVVEAQNEYSLAKMKRAEVEAAYNESSTELQVAKNELQQSMIEEKSAKQRKKAADKSNDVSRINVAASELRQSQLSRKAADQKVAYLKAQRKYLKKQLNALSHEMYAKEAKYEMAKAKVAQKKNIRPPGFEYKTYEEQYRDRSEASQRAAAIAKREKQKAADKEKKWKSLVQAAGGGSTAGTSAASGSGSAD